MTDSGHRRPKRRWQHLVPCSFGPGSAQLVRCSAPSQRDSQGNSSGPQPQWIAMTTPPDWQPIPPISLLTQRFVHLLQFNYHHVQIFLVLKYFSIQLHLALYFERLSAMQVLPESAPEP